MEVQLDHLEMLVLLVWLAVLLIFLSCVAAAFLSARSLRFDISVGWFRPRPASRHKLKPLLLAVAVGIASAMLLQISAGETLAMRLSVMFVGAGVTWISFDWTWKQGVAWTLRRAALAREWRLRSESACAEIAGLFEDGAILQAACRILCTELEIPHAFAYTFNGDTCAVSGAHPTPPISGATFSRDSLLFEELTSCLRFRSLRVHDPVKGIPLRWSRGSTARLEEEQARLASLQAQVVVPIQRELDLPGFFVLGPRESQWQPYHLRFAEELAHQVSVSLLACPQARAAFERVAEEARDQSSRRNVQMTLAHLAPPDRFELCDLDFAAEYWRGVNPGGCFYDVVTLPRGAAGFFLAEVEGPAQEAAIRLIQLQALLRTRAWAYAEDLAELLESTARALALSAASRPPIALFCARYIPGSAKLHYVNAGHYPPLLIRRTPTGAEVTRLTSGGPALGLPNSAPLQEGELTLLPGDHLVLSSKGLIAAVNREKETFGEGRLIQTILTWESQRSNEIAHNTHRAVEEFTAKDPAQPARALMVLRPVPAPENSPV